MVRQLIFLSLQQQQLTTISYINREINRPYRANNNRKLKIYYFWLCVSLR